MYAVMAKDWPLENAMERPTMREVKMSWLAVMALSLMEAVTPANFSTPPATRP